MSGPLRPLRLRVRIVIPLGREDLELENRQAIARWLERALTRRFIAGAIDVEHRNDQGIILGSSYAVNAGDAGALTAAAGVLELVDQAIDLALLDTRPARARHALERLFAGLRRATVTVKPDRIERTPA